MNKKALSDPPMDCLLCPRLVELRDENRILYPHYYNAPVPSFGDINAKLLVVGMAPGLRGANRTGRPFTGDYAGDLLYSTMLKFGFARGNYDKRLDDNLFLIDCRITNAVRCVPPKNKLTSLEINNCRSFLELTIKEMRSLKVIMALGSTAHSATLSALGYRKSSAKFCHNMPHGLNNGLILIDSYHCSRYNTQTGLLTTAMFHQVFSQVRNLLSLA
ncbi:uracil DNA glycosylase superfamily protein [Candidatus Endolissoclinum faulkneri L2]|uniref:Type-5 uracil-DNA glycosylase n=1 Tax=Candidatus Endolissoclinum faulkneri L2 TaxID=1193729 RepID=K7YGR3_9PROT|nr:uracil-DNA glycosylase [Candidatus Endolissoclinum faulkneri]AFX98770.1 uracil DNA glycosylase superfamily protein [Candidatus Endolissoclinum faulkneri L2]